MMPDLETKLNFNDCVLVEVSSNYEDTVMVQVYNKDDDDYKKREFLLEPDEVDLFISVLNLYKNRILKGRKIE